MGKIAIAALLLTLPAAVGLAQEALPSSLIYLAGEPAPAVSTDTPRADQLQDHLPAGTTGHALPARGKPEIAWVRIPGGEFEMGSAAVDWDEKPVHSVAVKTFEIAKTEVTVAQYRACVDGGACTPPGAGKSCTWDAEGKENHPVNCVDWNQAAAFSAWVGGRLPSEAEWEYAARSAGKERRHPWGDEDASCDKAVVSGCGWGTAPVCSKPAGSTAQGLCDMAGNVWEWVQDWFNNSYNGAPQDGSAWEQPPGMRRVQRGGSWDYSAGSLRASLRGSEDPSARDGRIGFRPAR